MGDKGRAKERGRRRPASRSCRRRGPTTVGRARLDRDQGRRRRRRQGHARRARGRTSSRTRTAAAQREAQAAFGDDRVLVERYLERPRHIEIQVLADAPRQRRPPRRARVLAPAPPPEGRRGGAVAGRRPERCASGWARRPSALARACGYEGAGTVEFIVAGRRVRVLLPRDEHAPAGRAPGDRAGLRRRPRRAAAARRRRRAAARSRRPTSRPRGHAIEARLYAEDPAAGFLPAVGTVRALSRPPGPACASTRASRAGSEVGTDYDPMLAKVIAHGPDRATALGRLDRALAGLELLGVATTPRFTPRAAGARGRARRRAWTRACSSACSTRALGSPLPTISLPPRARALARDTRPTALPARGAGALDGHGEVARRRPAGSSVGERPLTARARRPRRRRRASRVELDGVERRYAVARDGDAVWIAPRRPPRSRSAPSAPRAAAPLRTRARSRRRCPARCCSVDVAERRRGRRGRRAARARVDEDGAVDRARRAPAPSRGCELSAGRQVAPGQALVAVLARRMSAPTTASTSELIADLEARLERVRAAAAARRRWSATSARGKLLARERVERLCDPGAPFLELSRRWPRRRCTTATRRARASSPASAWSRAGAASSSPTTPPSRAAPTTR